MAYVNKSNKFGEFEHALLITQDMVETLLDNRNNEKNELNRLNNILQSRLHLIRLKSDDPSQHHWIDDVPLSGEIPQGQWTVEIEKYQKELVESFEKRFSSLQSQLEKLLNDYNSSRADYATLNALCNFLTKKLQTIKGVGGRLRQRLEIIQKELEIKQNKLKDLIRQIEILQKKLDELVGDNESLLEKLRILFEDLEVEKKLTDYYKMKAEVLNIKRDMKKEIQNFTKTKLSTFTTDVSVNSQQFERVLKENINYLFQEIETLFKPNEKTLKDILQNRKKDLTKMREDYFNSERQCLVKILRETEMRKKTISEETMKIQNSLNVINLELRRLKENNENTSNSLSAESTRLHEESRNLQEKLQTLLQTNQFLYAEIAFYRELLNCKAIEEIFPKESTVIIERVNGDGQFIEIKNQSTFTESLRNWTLKHKPYTEDPVSFKFSNDANNLEQGKSVKIWDSRYASHMNPGDQLLPNKQVWCKENKSDSHTKLYNSAMEPIYQLKRGVMHGNP